MRVVYVSAGHSTQVGKDRGAEGNGLIEGNVTAEFRKLFVDELKQLGVTVIVDGDHTVLNDTIAWLRRLATPNCLAIEFHCNAATPKASGAEVIVPDNPSKFESRVATAMSACISKELGIPNRGVKQEKDTARKRLGFMRVVAENVLPELFFISNKKDCDSYQKNKAKLARELAKVVRDLL